MLLTAKVLIPIKAVSSNHCAIHSTSVASTDWQPIVRVFSECKIILCQARFYVWPFILSIRKKGVLPTVALPYYSNFLVIVSKIAATAAMEKRTLSGQNKSGKKRYPP